VAGGQSVRELEKKKGSHLSGIGADSPSSSDPHMLSQMTQ